MLHASTRSKSFRVWTSEAVHFESCVNLLVSLVITFVFDAHNSAASNFKRYIIITRDCSTKVDAEDLSHGFDTRFRSSDRITARFLADTNQATATYTFGSDVGAN